MRESESDEEEYDNDEAVVSLIACGLDAVPDDIHAQATHVNLHGNFIQQIGTSFALLSNLVNLNLSSNNIEVMEGLGSLAHLRTLNLACNKIEKVTGLKRLEALKSLDLSHNLIADVSGFYDLDSDENSLSELRLKDNRVASVHDLLPLRNVGKLNLLELESSGFTNPLCGAPTYYKDVLHMLPQVKVLDPSRQARQQQSQSQRSSPALVEVPSTPALRESGQKEESKLALTQSSTQTEGDFKHVETLEKEAKTLGEQMETLRTNFQDYNSLRSLVQNLKDQQRAQLERQERVLKQEMEIYVQEKDIENQTLRSQVERAKSNEAKLAASLAEMKQAEGRRARESKSLGESYARAVDELRTLESFAEELTGKVEVERALRQRAEIETQEIMKRLNDNLSDFASVTHNRSQLQEKLFEMERRESSMKESQAELERSLQVQCKEYAAKERENQELTKKLHRLNDSLNEMSSTLAKVRSDKASLRDEYEYESEYAQRAALERKNEARKVKDMLFTWFDKMESSTSQLKKKVHGALNSNEERINSLFILKTKLSSAVMTANKAALRAREEKGESDALLEDLARVSENLQNQLAHSHAEQNKLKKLIAQQSKQLDKYVPVSKKYHKLCLSHEALEKKYEDECLRSQDLERRSADLRLQSAKAIQEAENSKIVSREELQRAEATLKQALAQETKMQHLQDEISTLGEVVKLKDTLLEDRNKSILELGASVKREQEDKNVIIESHAHALEQMKMTMDSLHDELNLQDQLAHKQRDQAARLEEELEEKRLKNREKDDMLQYVRAEIDNLKRMFEARERKLRDECKLAKDKAMETFRDKEKVSMELDKSKHACEVLISKLDSKEAKVTRQAEELELSKKNVEQVENEMRHLLKALESERMASQLKAQRVQSVLKELATT